MKKINVLYWVFTALFAGFMAFSAVPDIVNASAVASNLFNSYVGTH